MRLTRKRVLVLVIVLACAGYGIWWWAESGKVELEIGKDTTYITGPVNEDGTVNYVAHINAGLSEGVTPENNAAIILARAIGPALWDEKVRDRAMKLIGMAALPAEGDYFVALGDYVEGLPEKDQPQITPEQKAADKRYKELSAKMMNGGIMSMEALEEMQRLSDTGRTVTEVASNQLDQAMRGPWSADKLTIVAGWLKANAKPLALIETAARSRHIYIPLVSPSDPPQMIDYKASNLTTLMVVGKALTARGMLKSASGDVEGAWQDMMTARRLARLLSQGATLIEGLVGMAIDSAACKGCGVVIAGGKPSVKQLRKWLAEMEALEPLTDIRKAIATERFMCLDLVMALYREQQLTELTDWAPDMAGMSASWMDWNDMLRTCNHWYDRSLAPFMLHDVAERRARLKEVEQDMDKMVDDARGGWWVLEWAKLLTPTGRREKLTEAMTVLLLSVLAPSLGMIVDTHDEGLMQSEVLQAAAGLALHEAETGKFPAKLADLAPKYLQAVPADRFSGKALLYKRRGKGCVVYSVGMNLKDDGGIDNRHDEDAEVEKDDIVVRFKR